MLKLALAFVAVCVALSAPSTASAKFSPWHQPVQAIDPAITANLEVFAPGAIVPAIGPPKSLQQIYEPLKDGRTIDGGNLSLARPVLFPSSNVGMAWLVPGHDGTLTAWAFRPNGDVGMGMGGTIDDPHFLKYGWVGSGGGRRSPRSRWYSQTAAVVPSSVKVVRLTLRRSNGTRFARDVAPHQNVVLSNDRRVVAVRINGRTFRMSPIPRVMKGR